MEEEQPKSKCYVQINEFCPVEGEPGKYRRVGSRTVTVYDATAEEIAQIIEDACGEEVNA